jgi:hypothetical protein
MNKKIKYTLAGFLGGVFFMKNEITIKGLLLSGLVGICVSFLVYSLLVIVPSEISLILTFTIGLPFAAGSAMGASIFNCRRIACFPYIIIIGTLIYIILASIIYILIKRYKK